MSRKYSKSSKGKRFGKMLAIFAAGMLACAALVTVVGGAANGFNGMNPTNWFDKKANENNLIKVDENYIESQTLLSGVEIDVSENGQIKLKGEATQGGSVQVASVELEPGTYTISGLKKASNSNFSLIAKYGNNDVAFAGLESQTFEILQKQTVTIHLQWLEGYDFGVFGTKVMPEIVAVEAVK